MRNLIIGVLLCTLSCNPFENVKDVSDAVPLAGRCIHLRHRMYLIDSGGDELARNYLGDQIPRTNPSGTKVKAVEIPPGSVVHVEKVLLVKTFENTRVAVLGRVGNMAPPVSMALIFRTQWRVETRAALEQNGDRRKHDITYALDPLLAEWCGLKRPR